MIRATAVVPTAVIRKDLRLRTRGWRWAGVATLYVGILGIITVGFLVQKYAPSASQSTEAGIHLFQTLSIFQLLLILFVAPASVAGSISGERQHRTWDLLVLSRLSMREILWGKLIGGIAFSLLLIAGTLPLFALVFLFGGVGPADMIPAFVVFLVTVLFLASTSLTVSSFTGRLTVSYMVSTLIALFFAAGLSLLIVYFGVQGQPSVLNLAAIPFQAGSAPNSLTPVAQLDPLAALVSALPSDSGGTLLGGLGTVDHAFGLPWQLPLWGAYALLVGIISALLLVITNVVMRRSRGKIYIRP